MSRNSLKNRVDAILVVYLLARHGEKNEHGFAHHSDTRGANLSNTRKTLKRITNG